MEKIDGNASRFNQAVDIIEKKYSSVVQQPKVKNYLNTLRISNFINEGAEKSKAQAKLHKVINKIASKAPASRRGEARKIEFLHQAIVGFACVVQYRALQGPWKEKKLSGNDKLSGLGDTRVNNCTVVIFNYLILFS